MNWVKNYRLLATEAIQFYRYLCIKLGDFWQALYQTFNLAQNQHINLCLLNKIPSKPLSKWLPFSKVEFTNAIKKYSSLFTPEPDHLS